MEEALSDSDWDCSQDVESEVSEGGDRGGLGAGGEVESSVMKADRTATKINKKDRAPKIYRILLPSVLGSSFL
jgi:hypothetical protein